MFTNIEWVILEAQAGCMGQQREESVSNNQPVSSITLPNAYLHTAVSSSSSPWCRCSQAASEATSVSRGFTSTITSGNHAMLACRRLMQVEPSIILQWQGQGIE